MSCERVEFPTPPLSPLPPLPPNLPFSLSLALLPCISYYFYFLLLFRTGLCYRLRLTLFSDDSSSGGLVTPARSKSLTARFPLEHSTNLVWETDLRGRRWRCLLSATMGTCLASTAETTSSWSPSFSLFSFRYSSTHSCRQPWRRAWPTLRFRRAGTRCT